MPDVSTRKASLEVEPKGISKIPDTAALSNVRSILGYLSELKRGGKRKDKRGNRKGRRRSKSLDPRNLTWPLSPKIKETEFGGTITQLKAAGHPSGNVLLDFLKEQRLKLNVTPEKRNKTRTDWDKLHHVTFSKDNPVYSSYAREYFDKPIIPADTFYNMLVSQLGRSKEKRRRRSRSTPVINSKTVSKAKQGLPKLPPLRRRFDETNELLKVPYKDTAWKPVTELPRGKWDPRGHIVVSKDNHLLHPGQRSYLDRMLPGWATTNDSVWRGLCRPVKKDGTSLRVARKEHV